MKFPQQRSGKMFIIDGSRFRQEIYRRHGYRLISLAGSYQERYLTAVKYVEELLHK